MSPLALIAVGGNSIIKPGSVGTIEEQWQVSEETCDHVVSVIKAGYDVVLTHGNGPQVGNILVRSEVARNVLPTLPLDVCGADSQGGMGYMLQQQLDRSLKHAKVKKFVLAVLTQVVVDKDDPAFQKPEKPIGPFYTKEEADQHISESNWDMIEDAGRGYRRVVASPKPKAIVEERGIRTLIDSGAALICLGGGGIPVVKEKDGTYSGVAAVVDKDRSSSLLARKLEADLFIISTAVPQVCLNYGTSKEKRLSSMTIAEARQYIEEGHFKPGSMLPKIEALIDFVESGAGEGLITCPEEIGEAVKGNAGTRIVR